MLGRSSRLPQAALAALVVLSLVAVPASAGDVHDPCADLPNGMTACSDPPVEWLVDFSLGLVGGILRIVGG